MNRPAILSALGALLMGNVGAIAAGHDAGPFVGALWLVQRHGTEEAANPRNDQRTKAAISKALGKDGVLARSKAEGLLDPETFSRLAGPDDRLDPTEVRKALDADIPASRSRLLPGVAEHAAELTTSFDMIDEPHREAGEKLSGWIAANYNPGEPLPILVVCTGNSRRSYLGATMGNVAAAYCGLPEVRCYSGGTAPSACNPRTIAALKSAGVQVEPTGEEAPRGEPSTPNPIYRIRWGRPDPAGGPSPEAIEFSKKFTDPSNPQSGFAALMVCSEADAQCPQVRGAKIRISMPYLDPKVYDGGSYEAAKYEERRDDMGRLMLAAMLHARRKLSASGKLP